MSRELITQSKCLLCGEKHVFCSSYYPFSVLSPFPLQTSLCMFFCLILKIPPRPYYRHHKPRICSPPTIIGLKLRQKHRYRHGSAASAPESTVQIFWPARPIIAAIRRTHSARLLIMINCRAHKTRRTTAPEK